MEKNSRNMESFKDSIKIVEKRKKDYSFEKPTKSLLIKEILKLHKNIDKLENSEEQNIEKLANDLLKKLFNSETLKEGNPEKINQGGILFTTGYLNSDNKLYAGAVARNNESSKLSNYFDVDESCIDFPDCTSFEQIKKEFTENEEIGKVELLAKTLFWTNRTAKHLESFEYYFSSRKCSKNSEVEAKRDLWKNVMSDINRTTKLLSFDNILNGDDESNSEKLKSEVAKKVEKFKNRKSMQNNVADISQIMEKYSEDELFNEFREFSVTYMTKSELYLMKSEFMYAILDQLNECKTGNEKVEKIGQNIITAFPDAQNLNTAYDTVLSIDMPSYSIPVEVHCIKNDLIDKYGKDFFGKIVGPNPRSSDVTKPHLLYMLNEEQQKNIRNVVQKYEIDPDTKKFYANRIRIDSNYNER